jgi:hypothetical protein
MGGGDGRFGDRRSGHFGCLCRVSGWLHLRSVGGTTMTQNEKYEQYARQARDQVSHASNDADKAAWQWIAQSWLNLLGQNEPNAGSSGSDADPVKAG